MEHFNFQGIQLPNILDRQLLLQFVNNTILIVEGG
jgi:hypothetical protein